MKDLKYELKELQAERWFFLFSFFFCWCFNIFNFVTRVDFFVVVVVLI